MQKNSGVWLFFFVLSLLERIRFAQSYCTVPKDGGFGLALGEALDEILRVPLPPASEEEFALYSLLGYSESNMPKRHPCHNRSLQLQPIPEIQRRTLLLVRCHV